MKNIIAAINPSFTTHGRRRVDVGYCSHVTLTQIVLCVSQAENSEQVTELRDNEFIFHSLKHNSQHCTFKCTTLNGVSDA
jgi:hypothetical protein